MKTVASAPGKLVLLGEYAVLFGAPALVMAVDRRAVASVEDSTTPGVTIDAPDVFPHPVRLVPDNGALCCTSGDEAAQAVTLVSGLVQGMLAAGMLDADRLALQLKLDTSAFFFTAGDGRRDKLGLGSSAALTVALASALAMHAGHAERLADRSAWLQQLLAWHREFQHGRGSGLDVAASLYGGVIRYQLGPDGADAQAARWPAALQRLVIWSGKSASTSRFLAALDAWRSGSPERFSELMDELKHLAGQGLAAAAADDAGELLRIVAAFETVLQRLGEAAKIPIVTTEHARIRQTAADAGCQYKPCGAGGGDLGLALARSESGLAALRAALPGIGAAVVDLAEEVAGLRVEHAATVLCQGYA